MVNLNKLQSRLLGMIVIVFMLLMMPMPSALAQEPEGTAESVNVASEGAPESAPTVTVSPEVVGAGSMAAYMFLSFLAGGGTVLAAVVLVVRFILNSPVLIAFLEHLANSLPPSQRQLVYATGQLAVEATDGKSYADKPVDQRPTGELPNNPVPQGGVG
jgi:hypothetical protein